MKDRDMANLYQYMFMTLRLQAAILHKLINLPQSGQVSPVIMELVGESFKLAHELEDRWRVAWEGQEGEPG